MPFEVVMEEIKAVDLDCFVKYRSLRYRSVVSLRFRMNSNVVIKLL